MTHQEKIDYIKTHGKASALPQYERDVDKEMRQGVKALGFAFKVDPRIVVPIEPSDLESFTKDAFTDVEFEGLSSMFTPEIRAWLEPWEQGGWQWHITDVDFRLLEATLRFGFLRLDHA